MSRFIWTPDARRSEVRPYGSEAWRLVEALPALSSTRVVDSSAEAASVGEMADGV